MTWSKEKESALRELFTSLIPVHQHLDLELLELREGFVKFRLPFKSEFVGDYRIDRWHGGMVALLMDAAAGSAAMTTLTSPADPIVTVDLRVDYLRPATNHDLLAEGEVIRNGSSIVVCEGRGYDADTGRMLSRATGVFHLKRKA